ncbi:reverse transcriptase [Lasius niger]|uniref:Reverse transcriptase n=1 Tax=Lasius niger TaxID=67767 RepID=A0A0J7K874_LASNI|nr:reverse transcriptase [Lasius niger]
MTAWQKLIDTINSNPWGMPYRIVLNKLRHSLVSLTETLDEDITELLLGSLFLNRRMHEPSLIWENWRWEENDTQYLVTYGEVHEVLKKKAGNNTAPGPDGIKMNILSKVVTGRG